MSFDACHAPLDGLNLIEASAGTGKTWTIAALYARLVVEARLMPEQILVVTYTKAATAELRGRIRARLAGLVEVLAGQHPAADPLEAALHDYHAMWPEAESLARLRMAVSNFDSAAIFTIHGFCQRALGEQALSAGLELDREFIADERELILAAADAAWRTVTAEADADWLAYLVSQQQTPDDWAYRLSPYLGLANLQFALPAAQDTAAAQATFEARFAAARDAWQQSGADAVAWLMQRADAKQLDGRSHQRRYLDSAIQFWSQWLEGPCTATPSRKLDDKAVSRLFARDLRAALKVDLALPHVFALFEPLAEAAQALAAAYTARLAHLTAALVPQLREQVSKLKTQQGRLSFHDLLVELDAALHGEQGEVLAEYLKARHKAALIDEFQDTDPLQFRIFDRLFGDQQAPCFLVGDPKQAIYGFRGAELNAYLAARETVSDERRYTLGTNRRSTPALVSAVAHLFRQCPTPFMLDALPYPTVDALDDKPTLQMADGSTPALGWHWLGDGLGKGTARDAAVEWAADHIAALLSDPAHTLGGQPVAGRDIAVLASSHTELQQMHTALAARGIPSVRITRQSVFQTDEARDLLQVLRALAEPTERHIRAALATVAMGLDTVSLQAALHDEAIRERWQSQFLQWHATQQHRGWMAALTAWLTDSGSALRMAALQDGERRLTNLLHLFELIEAARHEREGTGPLLTWYRTAMADAASGEDDQRLMRLESDASRVRLITIHAAKGLEYHIVYCPFLWDGKLMNKGEHPLWSEQGQTFVDLGSADYDAHLATARLEKLAEKLRLLYVALTRPVSACFLAWGEVSEIATSALAWLLAGGTIQTRDAAALRDTLTRLIDASGGTMAWLATPVPHTSRPPDHADLASIRPAAFNRTLLWRWRMSSFSGLTAGLHDERPDHDNLAAKPIDADQPASRFDNFPAGPRAGVCLHTLFEQWDFVSTDRPALELLATRLLNEHGFDETWAPQAANMVDAALAAPIRPQRPDATLRQVAARDRLVELEFTYHLQPFDWTALSRLLADPAHGLPPRFATAAASLNAQVASGFLKGFIDLAFRLDGQHYVLDWKSNRLPDYSHDSLEATMAKEHYYLQALIYCVALHRYLSWRQPGYDYERDFGGAVYLFLRGTDPVHESRGIWAYRPSRDLMDALSALICGESR